VESAQAQEAPLDFGLIVVGDEVLNGPRSDAHHARFKELLSERGHALAWHWLLPDDPSVLSEHLRFSLARAEPVFVCGGIGATPDDHTRAAAAAAAGVALVRHPEAVALIEERFGERAYPLRILMAELPEGAQLVPNPYNRIPGFSIDRHFFLPGFPEMAWPMAEWVLDERFAGRAPLQTERAVQVRGIAESSLIPLMRRLGERFPEHKFFSLPHMGEDPHILFGVRGRDGTDAAFDALCAGLREEGADFIAAAQDSR
jgi:molybdopterin-biosynthesis enzyme MoeA-like protein